MKLWLVPIYATIGFLLIVFALPASRWIVLTQFDVIAGRWRYIGSQNGSMEQAAVSPVQRGIDSDPISTDDTAKFLRLLSPSNPDPDPNAYDKRFQETCQICKQKNDMRFWGPFIRVASLQAIVPRHDEKRNESSIANHPLVLEMLRSGCLAAIKLQPNNAWPRAILSAAQFRLGDLVASRQTLLETENCSQFDDFAWIETDMRYRYLVDHYGYRGERVRTWILFSTMYPDVNSIQSVCYRLSLASDTSARLATAHLSKLMMDQGRSFIEVIVGRNILNIALAPGRKKAIYNELSPEQLKVDAADLMHAAQDRADLLPTVAVYQSISSHVKKMGGLGVDNSEILNLQPAVSAGSLVSLLLLPLALGFMWLRARFPRFAAASPYLIWISAYFCDLMFGPWAAVGTGIATTWLLFFPALNPKARKYVDMLGVAVCALTLIASAWVFPLIMPGLLFLCGLVMERRITQVKPGLVATIVVVACALSAICWTSMASRHYWPDGVVFGLLCGIGLFSVIPVKPPIRWPQVAGMSALGLGLIYGLMVYRDIASDRQIATVNRELTTYADRVRNGGN
ncbi:MAG: hypothetical protein P4L46_11940 [Fimbriimonas sp.]|nr:hypothetical protein [Fimbriimonas sp.]